MYVVVGHIYLHVPMVCLLPVVNFQIVPLGSKLLNSFFLNGFIYSDCLDTNSPAVGLRSLNCDSEKHLN